MFSVAATEKRIRELVRNSGMCCRDFSKDVGIAYNAFLSMYNGYSKPSLESLVKIANKRDVSIDWLCTDD